MSAFKPKHWMRDAIERCKQAVSKIRMPNMIEKAKERAVLSKLQFLYHTYKFHFLKGFTAVGLLASISIGGNEYIKMNTNEVIHVLLNGQQVGTVSSTQVIDNYIVARNKEIQEENPDVRLIIEVNGLEFETEKGFMAVPEDELTLSVLDSLIVPRAVGTELVIDGESVGIIKDEETALKMLDRIKNKYIPPAPESGLVKVLSIDEPDYIEPGEAILESVDFLQSVVMKEVEIEPKQVQDPDQLLHKLETGDVKPTQYTVVKGDCISCIAQKLNITKQVIYDNNTWIQDDKLQIGDVIDLTVLQPTLTVVTKEKLVQHEKIAYETEYVEDDNLRLGTIVPISPGENGLKIVTYEIIKNNGKLNNQNVIDEEVILEPVTAVAKKGTKVILGEGTGTFSWPVLSSSLSSGYGMRWGKLHKGVDLISKNKNILASDNGKVVEAGYKSDYGNYIILDHLNGYKTLYGHLSQIYTKKGAIVEKGEKIGYMGSTGDSTGVHLHFEILRNGVAQNPMKYLKR